MYLVQDTRDAYLAPSHTLKHLIDQSSGSGSGLPLLVSMTTQSNNHKDVKWFIFETVD